MLRLMVCHNGETIMIIVDQVDNVTDVEKRVKEAFKITNDIRMTVTYLQNPIKFEANILDVSFHSTLLHKGEALHRCFLRMNI